MKVLLINSHTAFLPNLIDIFKNMGAELEVVEFENLTPDIDLHFDLIVLSGGHNIPDAKFHDAFEKEISLILNSSKPLIGICLGFKLIAQAYDSHIEKLPEKEEGVLTLNITKDAPVFAPEKNYKVYVTHNWSVKSLGPELELLADSEKGVQILKHKTRPIYGFQFHPEVRDPPNDGLELMRNAISQLLPSLS